MDTPAEKEAPVAAAPTPVAPPVTPESVSTNPVACRCTYMYITRAFYYHKVPTRSVPTPEPTPAVVVQRQANPGEKVMSVHCCNTWKRLNHMLPLLLGV